MATFSHALPGIRTRAVMKHYEQSLATPCTTRPPAHVTSNGSPYRDIYEYYAKMALTQVPYLFYYMPTAINVLSIPAKAHALVSEL